MDGNDLKVGKLYRFAAYDSFPFWVASESQSKARYICPGDILLFIGKNCSKKPIGRPTGNLKKWIPERFDCTFLGPKGELFLLLRAECSFFEEV